MHADARRFVAVTVANLPARKSVYEIGSLNINGSVRDLFVGADNYHGIDMVAGSGVDAVADGATYVPPIMPDTVVCCEVLEHTSVAGQIVARVASILQDGGVSIWTMAGPGRAPHSAVDGGRLRDGEFYRNVSPELFEQWCTASAFRHWSISVNHQAGDLYAVCSR